MAASAAVSRVIYVNGKFAAQATTGVQRFAACVVKALDQQVEAGRWVLLCPPLALPPALRRIEVRTVGVRGLPLHLWEQGVLPWASRDGWLLSLAGSFPALARQAVTLMHDAAVFDCPAAYRRTFIAWYRYLYRRAARRAVDLLTVSGFSRDRLGASLGVPTSRFTLLTSGADHLDGTPPDESILDRHGLRGVPFLLAIGSANPNKNIANLIAAFGSLPDRFKLAIAGGENRRVFAGRQLEAGSRIEWTGPVDDRALVALYRHAVALVFPSVYEGFGLPPLEAMRNGCPVAAARAASIPEVCGDAALYFDPGDPAGIAAALRSITQDEALRQNLRRAGAARAVHFRWADAAVRLRSAMQASGAPA